MEVRIIKTCSGFQKVTFLDGALLPPDADPNPIIEARKMSQRWEILHKYLKLALWPTAK